MVKRNNSTAERSGRRKKNVGRKHTRNASISPMKKLFGTKTAWVRWLGVIAIVIFYVYVFHVYVVSPLKLRWKGLYGEADYPTEYSIRGIDISHHQGSIDWEKLQTATIGDEPVRFVFIKATEGRSMLDVNFNDNFYKAREYGFIRGAYHYFKPKVSARQQAEYFLKQVHLEEGDLPPVLDIEETGGLSPQALRECALTWLKIVEQNCGVKPILYTYYKFRTQYLNTPEFEAYPYWLAHYYVKEVAYKGDWKFWQHTDCGKLSGIKGDVDLNVYNGSMYDLRQLTIGEE